MGLNMRHKRPGIVCGMKQIFGTIPFLLFVVSCSYFSSNKLEFKEKLSGEWKTEGMYKDGQAIFDTLYIDYPNKGDEKDFEIATISTDSGTYRHVHSLSTGQLIRIEPSKEVGIIKFVFVSDTKGKFLQYHSPGFDQRFEALESDGNFNLIFHNLDKTIDTTKVIKLDSQNLEILWTDGYVEKYSRNMP